MVSYQRRNKRTIDIHSNIESRVTAVETAVEHIESGMHDIKLSLDSGLSSIHDRIDDQSDNSKPNIVAWAGWAAVLLVIIGMFGSGYIRDLNRVEISENLTYQELHEHEVTSTGIMARQAEQIKALERIVFPQLIQGVP